MGNVTITSDVHVIAVPEDVTVKNAAAFKRKLLEGLQAHDRVSLDLSGVEALDMSFFQLLCAGHRAAMDLGKDFCLASQGASDSVRDAVKLSGFSRHVGCSFNVASSCLWLEE